MIVEGGIGVNSGLLQTHHITVWCVCPVIRSLFSHVWMWLSHQLWYLTPQNERMWFLSSDVEMCMPAWIGWKLILKPGEFPHPSHLTKNHQTEFHLHDRSFPLFHHSSPCPSKWNIQVAVLGWLLCSHQIPLWSSFMSCIDYAVENCFAVLGCFNRLETAEKTSYKKTYLIYRHWKFYRHLSGFFFRYLI